MCGITGKVYLDSREIRQSELLAMTSRIAYRGPDDEGVYISKDHKVGLGNRRLAIIDLSKSGHMPMQFKSRYWITYNGEIYNFQAERKKLAKKGYKFNSNSDTEVILALYDKYRKKCLDHLRGMFAFAIYDDLEKTIFLARDRIGKKPLKYFFKENVFIFASELKAILTQKEVKAEPDFFAINDYLTYGYVPSPKTGFKDINKLEPGHYLTLNLKNKSFKKTRYWQPDFSDKPNLSENEWKKKILDTLTESVKLRMISDVPIGAFLSGGVDSSAVVATMAKLSSKPVKTFTIGFNEKHYDEREFARNVAKRYKTDHTELMAEANSVETLPELVQQYEEPFADSSSVVTYMVSRLARKHVTVILNGDGGDENFAGYDRYAKIKRDVFLEKTVGQASFLHPLVKPIKRAHKYLIKMQKDLSERFISYNFYYSNEEKEMLYLDKLAKYKKINSYDFYKRKFEESGAVDIRDAGLYADLISYLPEDLLVKVDIASMAVSLEARSPLLDHNMVELAAKIPFDLKVKGVNSYKYIFKKALGDIVPKENLYRPKKGFSIPLSRWFENDLNTYTSSKLLRKKAKVLEYFSRDYISNMLTRHSETTDFGPRLWALLTLELWMESYFS